MRRLIIGVSAALLVGGYAWAVAQVHSMEGTEADLFGHVQKVEDLSVIDHHQLVTLQVHEGQSLLLEACSEDGFENEAWDATTFEVWYLPDDDRVIAKPMTELRDAVRHDERGNGCVVVTHRDAFGVSGELGLGVAWEALPEPLREIEMQGHGIAWTPIGTAKGAVWLILLGALGLVVGWSWPPKRDAFDAEVEELKGSEASGETSGVWRPLALALAALFGAMVALAFVPGGASMGVVRGLVIAGVEIAMAFLLVKAVRDEATGAPHHRAGLALVKPRWGLLLLAVAPIIGALVWVVGMMVTRLIPSTGVAPIETFVAAPSGALAVASIAVFVPIAEEVFFRGFIYGTLERARGANVATIVTVILFAIVHLPQQWGAWGPFASVTLTGIVLTLLRRVGRSTLLPAIVHLAHNALITLLSL